MRMSFIILFYLIISSAYTQEGLPEDFYATTLESVFDRPIGIIFDNQNNKFVWTKAGLIFTLDSENSLQAESVLDIREEVTDFGDHGLISMVLDPDFSANSFIYLYYTLDRHHMLYYGTADYNPDEDIINQATIGRVARYTLIFDDGKIKADPSSRLVLFGENPSEGNPILMASHGVGSICFGDDGSLFISCGDAGSFLENDLGNAKDTYHEQAINDGIMAEDENVGAFRSMQKNSLAGKILRIDKRTGEGLPENPFFNSEDPGNTKSKIWAFGFRNPYKMLPLEGTGGHIGTFNDPGKLLIGDVGSSFYEEVNLVGKGGGWYGWPKYEGYQAHWGFFNERKVNKEAENPAFQNGCGEQYFTYHDLMTEENVEDNYVFLNPCNATDLIPSDVPTYIHRRPLLAYSNDMWNPPAKTHVGIYDDNGDAKFISIDDDLSIVEGELIEGGSAIPGDICSIESFPDNYQGALFLVDFHGWINVVRLDENYQPIEIFPFAKLEKGITDLRFNKIEQSLYYVDVVSGQITKIDFGGDRPPKAVINADFEYGTAPLTINFDASQSISYSETGLQYFWEFPDGEILTEEQFTKTFTTSGTEPENVDLTLRVVDGLGLEAKTTKRIYLNNTPPTVSITYPIDGSRYTIEETSIVQLLGEVIDSEHSEEELDYEWQVNFHHDTHVHPGPVNQTKSSVAVLDPVGCGFEDFWYVIRYTATDAMGLSSSDTVSLFPYCDQDFSDIINLAGLAVNEGIELKWEDIIAENIMSYEVERTTEQFFLPITSLDVEQSGNYSYLDSDIEDGTYRYRIKAIDNENNFDYSNTIVVHFFNEETYIIYPNPTRFGITLRLQTNGFEKMTFKVFDASGRLIIEREEPNFNGSIFNLEVPLTSYPQGTYFYQLNIDGEYYSDRIIKM